MHYFFKLKFKNITLLLMIKDKLYKSLIILFIGIMYIYVIYKPPIVINKLMCNVNDDNTL